jgi:solute carrier family 25 S-adenosylmethionine transporter 26
MLKKYPELGVSASAIAACVGDTASSIVKVPREVITARLQSGMDAEVLKNSKEGATIQTLKLVLREQGISGLFRGFWSTTLRDWPFMIILFTTYESFKQNHHVFNRNMFTIDSRTEDDSEQEEITTLKSTIFGGVSGALAGFLTTPFDVIKTRIMTARGVLAPSFSSTVGTIWNSGGSRAFLVGATARSFWWFGICSVFFPLYEGGKNSLKGFVHKEIPSYDRPKLNI